ncbi:MAG: SpoIID/LytB domain-containing protein [bacterium]|nr:SpoIID/LytB domain-containing protein [bacterium]
MKKNFLLIIILLLVLIFNPFFAKKSMSDEFDDLNKQINDLNSALNMSINATKPLESELNQLQIQIKEIKARVLAIENDVVRKKRIIDNGYKNLAKQEAVLNHTIRDFYIKSYYNSPLLIFLSAQNASEITQLLAYQKAKTDQDKLIITNISLSIQDLEGKKKALEGEQVRLTGLKANLDEQSAKLDKIVSGAKQYQANLTSQIAQLSTKQQELLAQKLGSLNLPVSAYRMKGGCSNDLTNGKDPGFSPRFAIFTYGVPNRVGLNQFGAKGRAEAGQSAEQILKAYYNADYTTGYNSGINIHVVGTNEYGQTFDDNWNIEDYVKHLYEMPANWPSEALKAQAIAARSYALAYTNNGAGSICPSQQCQVVKKEINDGNWQTAVDATRGIVMTAGGQPIKAWFSSTHGGYVFNSGDIGWNQTPFTKRLADTTSAVNSFSDLQNNSYDKNSPIFYCDWGARSEYASTAWLKPQEMADIVNILLLAKADSGTQKHLSQVDKPNPDGVDTWDQDRVKQELRSRSATPYNNISDISVDWDKGVGRTTSVTVNGDAGSRTFGGEEFKTYFNLRAPSNINIVGPLYNAEKR